LQFWLCEEGVATRPEILGEKEGNESIMFWRGAATRVKMEAEMMAVLQKDIGERRGERRGW
jgi:hypothetical protein